MNLRDAYFRFWRNLGGAVGELIGALLGIAACLFLPGAVYGAAAQLYGYIGWWSILVTLVSLASVGVLAGLLEKRLERREESALKTGGPAK
jgi:hypothetical protein